MQSVTCTGVGFVCLVPSAVGICSWPPRWNWSIFLAAMWIPNDFCIKRKFPWNCPWLCIWSWVITRLHRGSLSLFTTQRHFLRHSSHMHTTKLFRYSQFCSIRVRYEKEWYAYGGYLVINSPIHTHLTWFIHQSYLFNQWRTHILWYRSLLTANIHNMRQQHTLI